MTLRNDGNYDLDVLRLFFLVDPNGWRLRHAVARQSEDGRGKIIRVGDLADTSISGAYRVCNLPAFYRPSRILVAPVIWVLFHRKELTPGMQIDHEDRDSLNNDPVDNLREVIAQANICNRSYCDGGFIGIFENRKIRIGFKRFQAVARDPVTKIRVSLKCHATAEEAARAYDAFVLDKHGPDAVTNASLGLL